MVKKFFSELWARVFVSYKSTIVGVVLGVGVILVDQLTTTFQAVGKPWATALAAVIALVGAFLKSKAATPPAP